MQAALQAAQEETAAATADAAEARAQAEALSTVMEVRAGKAASLPAAKQPTHVAA